MGHERRLEGVRWPVGGDERATDAFEQHEPQLATLDFLVELHRGTRRAWFGGAYIETPVLNRLALRPGESVAGPALIEERECTLVLPPGATARCDAALNLDVSLPG